MREVSREAYWPRGLGWRAVALVFLWVLPSAAVWSQSLPPLQSVKSLDVPRYLGRWYEIAKFPNRFQRQCVSDTSADYTLLPEGHLRVLNQCRQADGEWQRAVGLAKQVGDEQSARLEVRFAPAWLSFLPFVWGDYWVVDLDDKYELVAVSEPARAYLCVLSRSPVVDASRYAALLARLTAMGLDVSRLEKTPQPLAVR
jgi:apolipoprotein D and lipocalin family protein